MQVDDLRKAQRAAAALLNPDETVSTNCDPEFDALKTQLAVARHDDEIGVQVHQETLQRLGQPQPVELIAGCQSGGYAQGLLSCLTRTDTGRYLNSILVSSAAYYEDFRYRCCTHEKLTPKGRYGHYYLNMWGRLTRKPEEGCDVLPIWAADASKPLSLNLDVSELRYLFAWHAFGQTSLHDDTGTWLGYVGYNRYGLGDGSFLQFYDTHETSVQGSLSYGQLQPKLTFTIYQNYRTSFPSAKLTVDLAQGAFCGPYQRIYGIDELFDKGYNAVLLEVYDRVEEDNDVKLLKRLCKYYPGTYLQEEGTYLKDGSVQVTQQYELKPYPRPERRRPWYYHDWDGEEEYEDEDNPLDEEEEWDNEDEY